MTDRSRHAPGEQLSERVQRLANFADAHCSEDELLMLLVRAIREQQAALAACLGQAQKGPIPEITRWEEARAVLEKWRIK